MMTTDFRNVCDVVRWRLCVGCGACAAVCPQGNIEMRDLPSEGKRPVVDEETCAACGECTAVCPGLGASHRSPGSADRSLKHLRQGWGPVLEVWEGYASDPDLRYEGSSGAAASALALYCLEREGMHGVLHIAAREGSPLTNMTVLSRGRDELRKRTGSRYAPASPCEGLQMIEGAPGRCVFIGKPCDVTAVGKARSRRAELDQKVGITIGIFCAGTPSTQGTIDLLRSAGIDPSRVEELRYRGKGWPGRFTVRLRGEERPREVLSYGDSWGFVQKYRPYRCYLCPDGTSEFADLSCGDPWYREIREGEPGMSLILVRTADGRRILQGAMRDGYVTAERADPRIVADSQGNLLRKRGAIWGRMVSMRACGVPVPRLNGFSLFANWLSLPLGEKARSLIGTVRRILQRRYYRPVVCRDSGSGSGPEGERIAGSCPASRQGGVP